MGGLIGGIFDLVGGDPAKAQEEQLSSLANFGTGVGEPLVTDAAKFDEAILSGDPSAIARALAPEISAGQTQTQQAANRNAQFGTRSGGTAASTAGAEAAERGNIINLAGGLQQGAAGQAGALGSTLLGQASNDISNVANLKESRRAQEVGDVGGIASSAAQIAGGMMTPAAATPPALPGFEPGVSAPYASSGTMTPDASDLYSYGGDYGF